MKQPGKGMIFTIALLIGIAVSSLLAADNELRWFKGQTHCHTIHSDGDQYPRQVARWYRDHEYNFLFITDHNKLTPVQYVDEEPDDDFIVIPGEEVTNSLNRVPLHICGLNIQKEVAPNRGKDIVSTLQNDINGIRAAGGVPQLNHPNWKWAFADGEISQLTNVRLFEVYNMTRDSNNFAAGGKPGTEEVWDRLLSRGYKIYGVVSDDTHDLSGEFSLRNANPGQGWVMVRAAQLTPEAIAAALENGDFYGTMGLGVYLKEWTVTEKECRIVIEPNSDYTFTTLFIGKDGKILREVHGTEAVYTFTGDELYVRPKVICSTGDFAILQPVFPKELKTGGK